MKVIETKDGKKLYPLTSAQNLFVSLLKVNCPQQQVLNIGSSILFKDLIDFDYLKEAIKKWYERSEAFRLRFTEGEDGEIYQYVVPEENLEIPLVDFSDKTQEEMYAELDRWTTVPCADLDAPLNKVVMINAQNNYRGIYFLANHMTIDSSGLFTAISDLIEIYCSLKFGLPYPKEMQSYIKALEKDLKYEDHSPQKQKDELFWKEQYRLGGEPIYTSVLGTAQLEEARKKANDPNLRAVVTRGQDCKAGKKIFHLEPQPTRELLDYCERNEVPMVCLLLMGIRTYLSKQNNHEKDISIRSMISRRGTLLEKKSGGSRMHYFPCRTVVEENQSFLDGIRIIQQKQNEMFKHANFSPVEAIANGIAQYNHTPGSNYESIALTYQPLSMPDPRLEGIQYKSRWHCSGYSAQPLYLTVMHNSEDKGLDFYFDYQEAIINEQQLEVFYYYLCKIIFLGVQHQELTVGDIIRTV